MSILTVALNPCIDRTIEINGFEYGGLNVVKAVRDDPGGKGINVSRVLRSSGEKVFCTGIMATDGGAFIKSFFYKEDISSCFIEADGRVRTNIKIFDSKTCVTTEVNEKGFSVNKDAVEEFVRLYDRNLTRAELVILSGSVAVGIPSDIYKTLIEKASQRGIKTVLDADGERLKYGIEAKPYAVKPNLFELEQYLGRKISDDNELKSAAMNLVECGIELVAVSLGADGALFANKDGFVRTRPFKTEIKSTVGAGDTMAAAIAYSARRFLTLEETARLATAAGTLTAAREGTDFCSLQDAERMSGNVLVEYIGF